MSKASISTIALSLLLCVGLLAGCSQEEEPEEPVAQDTAVEVQTVSRGSISTENHLSGKVVSGKQESVFVALSARCTKVYVEVGDTVSAGQTLCTLDIASTQSNLELAQLNYDNAQASYNDQKALLDSQIEQYEKNLADTKALLEIGAASQAEVDAAQLTLDNAKASRTSALSQLEVAMKNYEATMEQLSSTLAGVGSGGGVVAPIGGTIASLSAAENSYVSSSMPVAVIDSNVNLQLQVDVSESLISKLSVGQQATGSISAVGLEGEIKVKEISAAANAGTGLYTVKLTVPSGEGLMAGMFADVTFYTDSRADTVVIPTEAILIDNEGQYVMTLDEFSAAHRVPVETGLAGSGVTEITAGLTGGESLVVVGQSYLSDGDTVRIVTGED